MKQTHGLVSTCFTFLDVPPLIVHIRFIRRNFFPGHLRLRSPLLLVLYTPPPSSSCAADISAIGSSVSRANLHLFLIAGPYLKNGNGNGTHIRAKNAGIVLA